MIRSIPYKQLLRGVFALAGIRYEDATRDQVRMIIEFIFERTKEVWDMYAWPEVTEVMEEAFMDGFFYRTYADIPVPQPSNPSFPVIYEAGKVLYFDEWNAYYQVVGPDPFYGTDYAGPDDGFATPDGSGDNNLVAYSLTERYIPWERFWPLWQQEETPPNPPAALPAKWETLPFDFKKGTIIQASPFNPRENCGALSISFSLLEGTGVWFPCYSGNTVWLQVRRRPIYFTGEIYDDALEDTYVLGDQVYHEPTGEFWERRSFPTVLNPVAGPPPAAWWTKLEYPAIFETFVKRSVFADYLRTQGAFTEAGIQRASAERHIQDEITKLAGQQGQVARARPAVRPRSWRRR